MAIPTLTLVHPGQDRTLCRAVALQLLGDEDAGPIGEALEQRAQDLWGGMRVAPTLPATVQDGVVLIPRAPQGMALTGDGQKDGLQVPWVARLRPPPRSRRRGHLHEKWLRDACAARTSAGVFGAAGEA
jgi:hypothetical protein